MKHAGLEGKCILLNFALFMVFLMSVSHILKDLFFLIGGSSYDVLLNMVHSIVCWHTDFTFFVDTMKIFSNYHKKQCLKNSASKYPLT